MTYQDVVAIFDDPGVRVSQMEIAGNVVELYGWKGAAGGRVTVTFSNGLVTEKDAIDLS